MLQYEEQHFDSPPITFVDLFAYLTEPRKIAHQIVTVREDVSAEIIQDLGCIPVC
jgi:hypothetical protein